MRLAIGSDERTHLTDTVLDLLRKQGHEVTLVGALTGQSMHWPEVGLQVAELVASHKVDEGLLFCWTGTGVSMAANKVPGIRAALCDDPETAIGARKWNNANILCLSLRRTSETRATEIITAWFNSAYEPNSDDDLCLRVINQIEQKYSGNMLQP
jgi:ribose 5-phosphate isomerase B